MIIRSACSAVSSRSHLLSPQLRLPLVRGLVTSLPSLRREQERLPQGHVRPRRKPYEPRIAQNFMPLRAEFDGPDSPPSVTPRHSVVVPADPKGVLTDSHAARDLLAHETLVIVRQLEMLNVFMGFEQANRYAICTPEGENVGFLAEEGQSFLSTIFRQVLRTHRPFRSVVMDKTGKPVLWIRRPFAFINSRIFVHSSEEGNQLVGEAQQQWHPWRRRYNIFQARDEETFSQFAKIDGGLFAWDFWLKDKDDRLVASINRNFRGLGRELFTDTGQYVIRFDAAGTELALQPGDTFDTQGQSLIIPGGNEGGLTLDQRAMTLATAVSIDFDYFSRHSGSGGMSFPFFMWGGDGGSEIHRGSQTPDVPPAGPTDAVGAGVLGGAIGASEDEQIYGPQNPEKPANSGWQGMPDDASLSEGMDGKYEDAGWVQGEEMRDPWGGAEGDEGLFGGGGGDGDWGDWST